MSVAIKTHPINFTFRSNTPVRVLREIKQRFDQYLLDNDPLEKYRETNLNRKVAATMTAGVWLKTLRMAQNISQEELGKELGKVSAQRISDWESSRRPIPKNRVRVLADYFGVSTDRFM